MISASIVGGSGYVGGEILRLLLGHPEVSVAQITSQRHAGQFAHTLHPNLRGRTDLRFTTVEQLEPCDLLLLGLPHGQASERIEDFAKLTERIIDCSADFRLSDPSLYERWYGHAHSNPAWMDRFVYGLPEAHRERIRGARYVSGVGCNATAVNFALLPLVRAGLLPEDATVIAEVKVGSSEGGNQESPASHHPERSGVVRSFAPVGHRHTAEVATVTGLGKVHLSITSVEMVRGALATCHAFLRTDTDEKILWRAFRATCEGEPFLRIVHDRTGLYRHPEPKLLAGSNFADIGWAYDPGSQRIVTFGAIDNLMKGAAGTAVQCLNLMCGFEETMGLAFPGLHPS